MAACVPPNILITSVGSGVGYGVLYSLRRADRPYRVIGGNSEPIAAGNFRCDVLYLMPPADKLGQYRQRLEEILARERPAMVIPGHDMELALLAEWRSDLEQEYGTCILTSTAETVRISNDKLECAHFFGNRFAATAADAGAIRTLIRERGFPLVVKPRQGFASRGVSVVFDANELAATMKSASEEMIVQEYLFPDVWPRGSSELLRETVYAGNRLRQEEEYSAQVVVGKSGQILGAFYSRNVLWHGVPFTVETVHDPDLEAAVTVMTGQLTKVGLRGPCNFQARRTAPGEYRFFEVNTRFTGITPVRADMHFNECDAVCRHFLNAEAAPPLACPAGVLAQRYISHDVFSVEAVDELRGSGRWHASI
jgi:carbamoyl-phosphate synthase large subunit